MVLDKKYRLGYVDEYKADIQTVYHYIRPFDIIEFKMFLPNEADTLETLYEKIESENLDILVIDYRLNEYANVNFLGSDLVKYVHERRRDFPCILLTSHPDEAIDNFSEVHLIYDKSIVFSPDENHVDRFFKIIKSSIEKYIGEKIDSLNIIAEMIEKESLTLEEEEKFIKADEFIETNLGGTQRIPIQLKSLSHSQELKSLIDEVQELLEKLKS